jgi:site-specific recombinase XerD
MTAKGAESHDARIVNWGDLPADVTPNVLRHSFASLAADLGYSDPTIGALIGHKGRTTTSRYTHFADPILCAAADAVADHIRELMGGKAVQTGPVSAKVGDLTSDDD